MTHSADYMVNCNEREGVVKIADGRAMPIEGIGNLRMSFWSGKDWVQIVRPNVTPAFLLGYNLLSFKRMADRGQQNVPARKKEWHCT